MPDPVRPSESLQVPSERRIHCRQEVLFSCVELGENNGGTVLNISQGGLALQAVAELVDAEFPKLRFQLSRSHAWVEAKARITWISDSKRTAGLEFVGLPDEARKQIKTWISLTNDLGGFEAELSQMKTPPISLSWSPAMELALKKNQSQQPMPGQIPPTAVKKTRTDFGKRFLVAGPWMGAVLAIAGLISVGYSLHRSWNNQSNREVKIESKLLEPSSTSSAIPSLALSPPAGPSGSVLQVGAMVHQENADALVDSLLRRNLPAFVSRSGTNRFYFVLVGPFNNKDSRLKMKSELEDLGLKPVRTEWKPSMAEAVDVADREQTTISDR